MPVPGDAFDHIFRDLLRPISALLDRDGVTEIMVNAYDEVFVEEGGRLRRTSLGFASEDDVHALLRALSQLAGQDVGPESPILEARLPDGSRVRGVVPPVSVTGPLFLIRRHAVTVRSVESLVEQGSIAQEAVPVLCRLVEERRNILVAGAPSTGKTTLLGALTDFVSPEDRVLLIEDTPELVVPLPHVVRLQCRHSTPHSPAVNISELLRTALRLRPDRVLLGELDQRSAFDLVQAIVAGHTGCSATVNARSVSDALARLEMMVVRRTAGLGRSSVRQEIGRAIDAVFLVARSTDGPPRLSGVWRVDGVDSAGVYRIEALYEDRRERDVEADG